MQINVYMDLVNRKKYKQIPSKTNKDNDQIILKDANGNIVTRKKERLTHWATIETGGLTKY